MQHVLGQLLKEWRAESAYASDDDFVFASRKLMDADPVAGLWLWRIMSSSLLSGRSA